MSFIDHDQYLHSDGKTSSKQHDYPNYTTTYNGIQHQINVPLNAHGLNYRQHNDHLQIPEGNAPFQYGLPYQVPLHQEQHDHIVDHNFNSKWHGNNFQDGSSEMMHSKVSDNSMFYPSTNPVGNVYNINNNYDYYIPNQQGYEIQEENRPPPSVFTQYNHMQDCRRENDMPSNDSNHNMDFVPYANSHDFTRHDHISALPSIINPKITEAKPKDKPRTKHKERDTKGQQSGENDFSSREGMPKDERTLKKHSGQKMYDKAWQDKFDELKQFHKDFGHCDVPQTYSKNKSLGKWVGKQREHFKTFMNNKKEEEKLIRERTGTRGKLRSCPLTQKRIDKLQSLDFKFAVGKGQHAKIHGTYATCDSLTQAWEKNFKLLQQFKNVYGHLNVFKGLCDPNTTKDDDRETDDKEQNSSDNIVPLDGNEERSNLLKISLDEEECSDVIKTSEDKEKFKTLWRWCANQRRKYRAIKIDASTNSSKVIEERFKRLEDIGFQLDTAQYDSNGRRFRAIAETMREHRQNLWDKRYGELCDYQRIHGDTDVSMAYEKNKSLARWVASQRYIYRQSIKCNQKCDNLDDVSNGNARSLTNDRIEKLKKIGFKFNILSSSFDENVEALRQFKLEHGHLNIEGTKENKRLLKWMQRQRWAFRNFMDGKATAQRCPTSGNSNINFGNISHERISVLEELGFDWRYCSTFINPDIVKAATANAISCDSKTKSKKRKRKETNETKTYVLKNIHSTIPNENSTNIQNSESDAGVAKEDVNEKLANFEHKKNTKPEIWNSHFEQLLAYREEFGNCRVPVKYANNPKLGSWVKLQREDYKHLRENKPSPMNEYRITKLESIGFDWSLATAVNRVTAWADKYEELSQYKREFGDCDVPQAFKTNPGLGKWVSKQRDWYRLLKEGKPSRLTDEKVKKLEKIGFRFFVGKGKAMRSFDQFCKSLLDFKSKYGHTNIPLGHAEDPQLGRWAYQQRLNYRKYKNNRHTSSILKDRLSRLEEVGFKFHSDESTIEGSTNQAKRLALLSVTLSTNESFQLKSVGHDIKKNKNVKNSCTSNQEGSSGSETIETIKIEDLLKESQKS